MKLEDSRILLTGANGGIGTPLARQLAEAGARLYLVDRNEDGENLVRALSSPGVEVHYRCADLLADGAIEAVVEDARKTLGGIDVLVNLAGCMNFGRFTEESPQATELMMRLNVMVPMRLAKAVLPDMLARGDGRIVNIGSIFGSIGFGCFATYSATKSALRGFSEALRREIDGTGVGVTYIAPRAVRTGFNTEAVYRMAEAVKMNFDSPEDVARIVVEAVRKNRDEVYIGFPESLFVRINALFPRLVDRALRKQNAVMQRHAVS